ncbi:MAG TPA: hypothetical protein VF669_05365, partial [Tepidisphaeraceae bacterium]
MATFLLSAGLLGATSYAVARIGRNAGEQFWLFVGSGFCELATVTEVLSWLGALTPMGFLLAQLLVLLMVSPLLLRKLEKREPVQFRATWSMRLMLTAMLLMAAVTGIERFVLPVSHIDDRMYFASRAAYWMQNRSALHFDTHNQRQIIFPIGATVPFFWPLLFTRSEAAGQLVFWLAYPLLGPGIYLVLRQVRASRVVATTGALLLMFTPQVLAQTRGAHSELWVALFSVGTAYWALAAWTSEHQRVRNLALAAVFATVAVSTRITAMPLLVSVLIMPMVIGARGRGRAFAGAVAGLILGIVLSGWLLTLIENGRVFRNPLGPAPIRRLHTADHGLRQLTVHTARFLVTIYEPPLLATHDAVAAYPQEVNRLMERLQLGVPLPGEGDRWPGPYVQTADVFPQYYGVVGYALIPALAGAWVLAVRDAAATFPRVRLGAVGILAVLATPFLLAVVYHVRWMGLMGRFWVAPFALILPII